MLFKSVLFLALMLANILLAELSNKKSVVEEESVFRAVKNKPQLWKTETGEFTSAVFKDSRGVSLDIGCQRNLSDIIDLSREKFCSPDYAGIAEGAVKKIYEISDELIICEDALPDNEYHAILYRKETIELTRSQCRHVKKKFKMHKY